MEKIILEFEKDLDERWYIVLPDWPHDRANLEMVSEADALCDILSHHRSRLEIEVTEQLTPRTKVILHRWEPRATDTDDDYDYGAYYRADFEKSPHMSFDIWLCPVTKFVFNEYPNVFYIE